MALLFLTASVDAFLWQQTVQRRHWQEVEQAPLAGPVIAPLHLQMPAVSERTELRKMLTAMDRICAEASGLGITLSDCPE